jgi:membrane protein YqaA with SNARE-associated domain
MHQVWLTLAAWGIVFVVNIIPVFMPPTWAVLSVFHVTTDVPLLVLTVGGAFSSALGRIVLAIGAGRLRGVLPESDVRNAAALGGFINRHRAWRLVIVFVYCLAPIPSNPIFIAAGIGRVPLLPVAAAFFVSRAIADTFWVWTAGAVSESTKDLFVSNATSLPAIALQFAAVAFVVLVLRLPWAKWIGLEVPASTVSSPAEPG